MMELLTIPGKDADNEQCCYSKSYCVKYNSTFIKIDKSASRDDQNCLKLNEKCKKLTPLAFFMTFSFEMFRLVLKFLILLQNILVLKF